MIATAQRVTVVLARVGLLRLVDLSAPIAAGPFGDLPLAVLAARRPLARCRPLPRLSMNAVRRIVAGATHESLVARRDHAAVVADAIRAVVATGRDGRLADHWMASTGGRTAAEPPDVTAGPASRR